ncbi:MAG: hypothetical protein JSS76_08870 [Bacteroidetes bacterium]|nr:hypothetical protein [Bacteroidota bacterium]MBS1684853.1 hypothetical protein [Bacteroidota bacterium]
MAGKRKQMEAPEPGSNYEKIKDEVVSLITGQETGSKEDINYAKVVARVTLILVALYGIGRVKMLRQLAFSIASAAVTKWLADKAAGVVAKEIA